MPKSDSSGVVAKVTDLLVLVPLPAFAFAALLSLFISLPIFPAVATINGDPTGNVASADAVRPAAAALGTPAPKHWSKNVNGSDGRRTSNPIN